MQSMHTHFINSHYPKGEQFILTGINRKSYNETIFELILEINVGSYLQKGFPARARSRGETRRRSISLHEEFVESAKDNMGGSRGVGEEVSGNAWAKLQRAGDAS